MLWSSSFPGTRAGRSTRRNIFVSLVCNQLIVALQKCVLTIIALRFEYVKKRREKKGGNRKIVMIVILLKNPMNASTRLSMNGKSPIISTAPPFVLRLSKDERRVFQQNRLPCLSRALGQVPGKVWLQRARLLPVAQSRASAIGKLRSALGEIHARAPAVL